MRAQGSIRNQPVQGPVQGGLIFQRCQQTVRAICHHLWHPAGGIGDAGDRVAHGFDIDQTKGFIQRRRQEDIGLAHQVVQRVFLQKSMPNHAPRPSIQQPLYQRHIGIIHPAAHQIEDHIVMRRQNALHHRHDMTDPLAGFQTPEEEHAQRLITVLMGGLARLQKPLRGGDIVNAMRHDHMRPLKEIKVIQSRNIPHNCLGIG
mmetsp:Transcript_27400/g.50382  ORF Transcript_27400/g.50382 Transcript_27400/m.50382 type:complete len:203 (+) Transcript_27400:1308-1916(+)